MTKIDTYDFTLQKYGCIEPMTKNDRLQKFCWKISSPWNPDLVTFKIWDMDVVYMNELLEKRRSHGMNYFGKDKKLKS